MPAMTWSQFYETAKRLFRTTEKVPSNLRERYGSEYFWTCGTDKVIRVEWATGGASGGNCWGGESRHYVEIDPEPDLKDVDALLMEVCPKLPFPAYKDVLKAVVRRTTRTENEYYGNYTEYGVKTVAFRDLYDALVDVGAFR